MENLGHHRSQHKKSLKEKLGKDKYWLIGAGAVVVMLFVFLFYQIIGPWPVFVKYSNDEIEFEYPKWTSKLGYLVKSENPIRGAGIEVVQKVTNNLPLRYSAAEIKTNLTKDRTLVSEEVRDEAANYVLEFSGQRGLIEMHTKVVTGGANTYVLSAYSLKSDYAKNQKLFDRFLNSVKIKKDPLLKKVDLMGTIVKVNGSTLIVFSDKGQEFLVIVGKGTKIFNKTQEIKAKDIKENSKFLAGGTFDTKSKSHFLPSILVVLSK